MKINKNNVDRLPLPESGQALVWDDDLKGFGVRLTPRGRIYIVQGRIKGKCRRISLGRHGTITPHLAREKAKKVLVGFLDGVDPKEEQEKGVSLREVTTAYIADRRDRLKPSSVRNIEKHLNKAFADWADHPVTRITRDLVADRHTELTKRGPAQADQAFRVLRFLLNYARARYRPDGAPILPENPVEVLNRGQRGLWNTVKPREVRIPDGKIGEVWNLLQELRICPFQTVVSKTCADITTFLLLTGCRWSEAAMLTWDRVNLEEGWIYLPDPKNRNPITLPLSSVALQILKERPRRSDYVFPGRTTGHIGEARGTLDKVSTVAGVHICAHDLRRTFTVIGLKHCRLDLWKIKLLTNHKLSGDVTLEVYSDKSDLRFLAPETELISQFITGNTIQTI